MDGGGDFGGWGNERPGHGYFAGQDRGRDLAREMRNVRRAKRRRPWWAFWRSDTHDPAQVRVAHDDADRANWKLWLKRMPPNPRR
jgi:hypothetical protein